MREVKDEDDMKHNSVDTDPPSDDASTNCSSRVGSKRIASFESPANFTSQLEDEGVAEPCVSEQNNLALSDMILEAKEQVKTELWHHQGFSEQGTLNMAPCNFGKVICVKDKRGVRFAAKKMPIAWTQLSHSKFLAKRRPGSLEQPWVDIGVVKMLNSIQFPFAMQLLGSGISNHNHCWWLSGSLGIS